MEYKVKTTILSGRLIRYEITFPNSPGVGIANGQVTLAEANRDSWRQWNRVAPSTAKTSELVESFVPRLERILVAYAEKFFSQIPETNESLNLRIDPWNVYFDPSSPERDDDYLNLFQVNFREEQFGRRLREMFEKAPAFTDIRQAFMLVPARQEQAVAAELDVSTFTWTSALSLFSTNVNFEFIDLCKRALFIACSEKEGTPVDKDILLKDIELPDVNPFFEKTAVGKRFDYSETIARLAKQKKVFNYVLGLTVQDFQKLLKKPIPAGTAKSTLNYIDDFLTEEECRSTASLCISLITEIDRILTTDFTVALCSDLLDMAGSNKELSIAFEKWLLTVPSNSMNRVDYYKNTECYVRPSLWFRGNAMAAGETLRQVLKTMKADQMHALLKLLVERNQKVTQNDFLKLAEAWTEDHDSMPAEWVVEMLEKRDTTYKE